ncbi:MAG: D-alanine--D-alanine ligase family protein [Pseudomonadota bacterium]
MSRTRMKIAVLYGGISAEHQVSMRSAASVCAAIDRKKFEVIPVYISSNGSWHARADDNSSFERTESLSQDQRLVLSPDPQHGGFLVNIQQNCFEKFPVDIVFPVLHGTFGEDGTVQGLLDLAGIPYVGCGTLASAVGMDKIVMKAVFRDCGLAVGPCSWFYRSHWKKRPDFILEGLRNRPLPLFVKPANLGSSVGISRVDSFSDLPKAIDIASTYDRRILVEDAIYGRELEISVLGNEDPVASIPGEVISHAVFYDYDEKYLHDTAELIIPAQLTQDEILIAQDAALKAYTALDGTGLARVDIFLTPNKQVVINEINTLPGFTSISMYPKLWEAAGLEYGKLIDRLVELALARYLDRKATLTNRSLP